MDAQAALEVRAGQLAEALSRSLSERVVLCDLFGAQGGVLERNVSVEVVRRYKRSSLAQLAEMADLMRRHLPELGDDAQVFCLMSLVSAGALSAYVPPPPSLVAAYADEPALGALNFDLRDALRMSLTASLGGRAAARLNLSVSQWAMQLPVMPPVAPMLAKSVTTIPPGASYEPKWDGFRSICFRDGDEVELGSRNERPMTRYFPELVAAITGRTARPMRRRRRDRDRHRRTAWTSRRCSSASTRPTRGCGCSPRQTPASFIAFDLLALGDDDLTERPFAERRAALVAALAGVAGRRSTSRRPPPTMDEAQRWFTEFEGAGLDGVIAKPLDGTYQPDKRVMFKIKHERTADCVVAGYRVHKSGPDAIGSLLLGLYNDDGTLASVGVIGAFPMARRQELFTELQPLGHRLRRPPVELGGPRGRRRARRERARVRAGTPARTCRSCRCAPSGWSRCATTTWRASGSATPRSSTAGARTATRNRAPTSSSSSRSPSSWTTSFRGSVPPRRGEPARTPPRTAARAPRRCWLAPRRWTLNAGTSPTVRSNSSSSAPPPASTSADGVASKARRQRTMFAATVSCLIASRRLRHSSAASLLENGTSPALPRVHSLPIASAGAGLSRNSRRPSSSCATWGPSTRSAGVRLTRSASARGCRAPAPRRW